MLKKITAALCVVALMLGLSACAAQGGTSAVGAVSSLPQPQPAQNTGGSSKPAAVDEMRIAGLKGPTTMGMVKLMQDVDTGVATHDYQIKMYGTPDEIVPKLISGEIDAAALPANLASVLYNSTDGAVQVAAINTLGVLYVVENGNTVQSVQDLRGKTIYSTGKGTTPEFVLNYILTQNGLTPGEDVTVEYKSEATEVAALLAGGGQGAVAVLPQPYVTAVQLQNEGVRVALDLTEEWADVGGKSALVTGVLVARRDFIEDNSSLFEDFLQDYEASIGWVKANTQPAATLVAEYGIVEKAPVAAKALPGCNLTYVDGGEMEAMLSGYLQVLYDQLPESVGKSLPDEAFYYGV